MQRPPPPHQAAPADVEAGAVVLNVHSVDYDNDNIMMMMMMMMMITTTIITIII